MSKVLVIYATHFGQTRAIALKIAERLRALGAETDVIDAHGAPYLPGPRGYDVVVLGSRVEIGRHHARVVDYIRDHRVALARIPTAVFSVSMAAASPVAGSDPSGYLADLFESVDWVPAVSCAFAGGLPYRKYGLLTRFIMKRIAKRAGYTTDTTTNHEFTDWDEVREFADEIATRLPTRPVARLML